ncbi:MAG: dynamin family protein [Pirellulaceae bacterium]|nr:dynamin family protein [Pirellulaceae bacterium]
MNTTAVGKPFDLRAASFHTNTIEEDRTSSFHELSIGFFAAIVNADQTLLLTEYSGFMKAVERLTRRSLLDDTVFRAEVLELLLKPRSPNEILVAIKKVVASERVSLEPRLKAANEVLALLEVSPSFEEQPIALATQFITAIGAIKPDISARLEQLRQRVLNRKTDLPELKSSSFSITSLIPSLYWTIQGKPTNTDWLGTAAGELNCRALAVAEQTKLIALAIGDDSLMHAAKELELEIQARPFRIVLVGELKHGKSSLFNAIAGQDISPRGTSVATTSAVIELFYADEPSYAGTWLRKESIDQIREYIAKNATNHMVAAYKKRFETVIGLPDFAAGGKIEDLESLPALTEYVTAEGVYACGVERISIGLPLDLLRAGAVIVDTPGLNDPMKVRDYITVQEVKQADCVLFVLRADKLGTDSERRLLKGLLQQGRAIHLVPVLTFVDRLPNDEARKEAISRATEWLNGVLSEERKNSAHVAVAPVCAIDASNACLNLQQYNSAFENRIPEGCQQLVAILGKIASAPQIGDGYISPIENRIARLRSLVKVKANDFNLRAQKQLPDDARIEQLEIQAKKFHDLANLYRNQIQSRLESVKERLVFTADRFERELDQVITNATTEYEAAVEAHVRMLGTDYAKSTQWELFDNRTGIGIFREHISNFEKRWADEIQLWMRDIDRFATEMKEKIETNIQALSLERRQLADLCKIDSRMTNFLCRTDRTITAVSNLAISGVTLFAMGAIVQGATGSTALISGAGMLASIMGPVPLVLGIVALGLFAYNAFKDPEKRKSDFVKAKVEKARVTITERLAPARGEFSNVLRDVWEQYLVIAEGTYNPLIREAVASAVESTRYAQVVRKVKHDVRVFAVKLLEFERA